jgi:hypothetical protein
MKRLTNTTKGKEATYVISRESRQELVDVATGKLYDWPSITCGAGDINIQPNYTVPTFSNYPTLEDRRKDGTFKTWLASLRANRLITLNNPTKGLRRKTVLGGTQVLTMSEAARSTRRRRSKNSDTELGGGHNISGDIQKAQTVARQAAADAADDVRIKAEIKQRTGMDISLDELVAMETLMRLPSRRGRGGSKDLGKRAKNKENKENQGLV